MKTKWAVLSGVFLLTAFGLADDIIAKLGLQSSVARQYILSNIAGDFSNEPISEGGETDSNDAYAQLKEFRFPYTKQLPAIIQGDKVTAAKELCAYVKTYCTGDEFAEMYRKKREAAKPVSEPWRPDAEQLKAQQESVEELGKQLAELKKNKQIPASALNAMEKTYGDAKKQVEDSKDPTPNKTLWEKKYPADVKIAVRNRLKEYLEIAATVDFSAQLTPPDKYGRKKFINPAYEKQTLKWKSIFRAGKEVNVAVTAFIQGWLKEL